MVREINEDSCNIIAGYPGVPVSFIIADGMGGHNSGEIASTLAVDYVTQHILQNPKAFDDEEAIPSAIQEIMEKANVFVYEKSKEHESDFGMGTTLILTVTYLKKLFIGHIGDSRVYVVRSGNIERITTDHSYIEELIKIGSITREEAENHPKKNIITRALGCMEEVQADIYVSDIREGDIFVLCTDGLTNMLPESYIKEIVENTEDPEAACTELVNKANGNGGEDNITVIVMKN